MSKRGKAQNKERRRSKMGDDARRDMSISAHLIGDLMGPRAQCLQAAALMISTARALGHEVEPRLVSTLGMPSTAAGIPGFVTGSVAADEAARLGLPEHDLDGAVDFARDWAGHAVVVLQDPPTLFDPNFRQFSFAGFPPISIAMPIPDTEPSTGFWEAKLARHATVRYLRDDRNAPKYLANIESMAKTYRRVGYALASKVRTGFLPPDPSWVDSFIPTVPAMMDESDDANE